MNLRYKRGQSSLLPVGGRVRHDGQWQTVAAVGWVGERYYWLVNDHGVVSMVPASMFNTTHESAL